MGKTADLTVVQKTIIDTLHKEGKPQTFIAKEVHGVSTRAVACELNVHFSTISRDGKGVSENLTVHPASLITTDHV